MKSVSRSVASVAQTASVRSTIMRAMAGLAVATAVSSGDVGFAGAQAQEAIMLERIGAVRMVPPEGRQQPQRAERAHIVVTSAPVTALPPQSR